MSLNATEGLTSAKSATVITVSDRCAAGLMEDEVGPQLMSRLQDLPLRLAGPIVVSDDVDEIRAVTVDAISKSALVVLTGGTGISDRDNTPEAVMPLCQRSLPGMAEAMRIAGMQSTPTAMLSRQFVGVSGKTLVMLLPGSPSGALESLDAVWPVLPHALNLLAGETGHKSDAVS